jgi:hypothetical protein
MSIKNDVLLKYLPNLSTIYPVLETISGDLSDTLSGYDIEPKGDTKNYPDGKPVKDLYEIGDKTVTEKSSQLDTDFILEKKDHGELMYSHEGIKNILDKLQLPYDDKQIIEGKKTNVDHSLIFLIKSPATLTVQYKDTIYTEEDGFIYIPDAQEGTYTVKAHGTDYGKYTIVIGKIYENNDSWQEIKGEITNNPPSSQIDSYDISYLLTPSPTPTINPVLQSASTPLPSVPHEMTPTSTLTNLLSNSKSFIQTVTISPFISQTPFTKGNVLAAEDTKHNKKQNISSKNNIIYIVIILFFSVCISLLAIRKRLFMKFCGH